MLIFLLVYNVHVFGCVKISYGVSECYILQPHSSNEYCLYENIHKLFDALSSSRWLKRGFAIVTNAKGKTIFSVKDIKKSDTLSIQLVDGKISTKVDIVNYDKI